MNILPQPGNDWKSWARALVSALQAQGQSDTSYIVDTSGRPIVTPQGIYAYSGSGASVVAPDLVSINTEDLVNAAITTAKLADTSVSSAKLVDLAVQAAKLADSAVTSTKIANAAVGQAAIADAAVGTAQIANAAITSALIGDLEVIRAKIADAAINDAKVANLSAAKLIAGTIGAGQIYVGNDAVEIDGVNKRIVIKDPANGTPYVYIGTLPDGSIGIQILDDTGATILESTTTSRALNVQSSDVSGLGALASIDALTSANISTYIEAAAIGNAEIGAAAVETANIQAGAITSALIGDAQITSAKIADLAVNTAQIADAAIGTAKIGDASVDTLQIAGNAVTVPATTYVSGSIAIGTGWTTIASMANVYGLSSQTNSLYFLFLGFKYFAEQYEIGNTGQASDAYVATRIITSSGVVIYDAGRIAESGGITSTSVRGGFSAAFSIYKNQLVSGDGLLLQAKRNGTIPGYNSAADGNASLRYLYVTAVQR